MCTTCGCGSDHIHLDDLLHTDAHEEGHHHTHTHDDALHHHHYPVSKKIVDIEKDVLNKNNTFAERNRGYLDAKNIFTVNLVSSPGSGKTTLLENSLKKIQQEVACYVIEGDQQTKLDAQRIKETGTPVVQINTGKGCHLDAEMIHNAIKHLKPEENSLLMIENVGNLVCPALFDLGENARVVIISTTEGDDKPLKYPEMFRSAQLCVINKTDLLPYVTFDMEKCKSYARKINPQIEFIELSATSGDGMQNWIEWLRSQVAVMH